jgi:predicted N-acyltransferase
VYRPSLVDFDLELPGSSFDDYLASLSRRRRGEVRREIRAARGLRFEDFPLSGHEHLVAAYRRLAAGRHGRFTDLDASFYEQLAENMGERSRVLLAMSPQAPTAAGPAFSGRYGWVIGASCYLEYGGKTFLLHGGAVRERFAYFNLTFYELIRLAYRRGIRSINFRPAGDEAKSNRGCVSRRTVACFEPISLRGRAALAVLAPALDSRRWIERRLRRAWGSLRPREDVDARPVSGSTAAGDSRS